MEIEAKFAVLSEETFSALRSLVHLGEYDLTPGETLHLHDTYLDTPDHARFMAVAMPFAGESRMAWRSSR